jgi:hypothetical protein
MLLLLVGSDHVDSAAVDSLSIFEHLPHSLAQPNV